MFDTGLFASQGRDRDGESAGKEKKGWRAHELRKNEFKITLADVKIGRTIGRGAYGVVCEGTYKGFPVAVKTLHAGKSTLSRKEKTAFECEISLLSRLSHVNIVTFYGACTDDKDHQLCVVMELMSKSLFQVLHENDRENRKNRRLTRLEFLRVASDVAAGCEPIHRRLKHRRSAAIRVRATSSTPSRNSAAAISTPSSSATQPLCPVALADRLKKSDNFRGCATPSES